MPAAAPSGRLGLALFLLLALFELPAAADGLPVTELPGWKGALPSKQDAGYITVDDTLKTRYFYWYIEAEVAPETAPLVVWYSGGPGGSGMIGLWTETGPLRLDAQNHPYLNPIRQPKHNVLYLEQPCESGRALSLNTDAPHECSYSLRSSRPRAPPRIANSRCLCCCCRGFLLVSPRS